MVLPSHTHTLLGENGKDVKTLLAKAGEREEILLATFDMDDIRAFRAAESWRWSIDGPPQGLPIHTRGVAPDDEPLNYLCLAVHRVFRSIRAVSNA